VADVELRELVKTYPGATSRATDDVSLSIADGEFMVLLGPSGCGKTTLLRAVAGLELPDSGQVVIGGRDVTYLEPRHRNLSMVFQSYAVFPHKKVRDNIGFGLKVRGVPAAEVDRKVAWAAEMLQLSDYLDRYPAKLSGGQRQRVAVARAIVVESDVLLMDEPLSNLDALLRLSFRADLKKLVNDLGRTTIYVTHDQIEALSLGDRVAVMREGRVSQVDVPTKVYDDPADEFVGGFLGSPPMNFLSGTVSENGHGLVLDLADQHVPVPRELADYRGRELDLGVRAEALRVLPDGEAPGASLRCTVDVYEPLGSSVLLTTDLAGHRVKIQTPASFRAEPGDELRVELPGEQCRWYDPETKLLLEVS
jgi:multiple sugar transport system ATP-binding protein